MIQNKQQINQSDSSEFDRQNRLKIRISIRVVAILYLCYLMYSMVQAYLRGQQGILLWQLILVIGIFVVLAGILIVMSVKQWKRGKARYQKYLDSLNRDNSEGNS